MISVNDFRTGLTIELDKVPWQVMEFQHVKPGKGAAFVRAKLRNMRSAAIQERTFRAGEKVAPARVETRAMQYLYASGDEHAFMDSENYEQMNLPAKQLTEELKYLQENMDIQMVIHNGEIIGIQLPNSVTLLVTETDPGVRGDTATGGTKSATLSTGLVVQVPLFIELGDQLVIDTRTGAYVSRA